MYSPALLSLLLLPILFSVLSQASFPEPKPAQNHCNCTSVPPMSQENSSAKDYICANSLLGPVRLPTSLPLSSSLTSYFRFGPLSPGEFLARWFVNGSYIYPPQNGFSLNEKGEAINGTMILEIGTLVDRFGSEYGNFISAADAPYSQRALPPASLDTSPSAPDFPYNYHVYRVVRAFAVIGGPIAPWFGQPGLGAQFYTGDVGNIMYLITGGYLERVDPLVLVAGKKEMGCGDAK